MNILRVLAYFASYTISEENWRLLDKQSLKVIEFLLFRITKKNKNKTQRNKQMTGYRNQFYYFQV